MPKKDKRRRRELSAKPNSIVIIGGGASGTILAVRGASEWRNTDIYLIERTGNFGTGLAYASVKSEFVLNVPAVNMGAYAEEPDHFYRWLQENEDKWRPLSPSYESITFTETDFVPRIIYGAYLQNLLQSACENAPQNGNLIHKIHGAVEKVVPQTDTHLTVLLADGRKIPADSVVFATGNSFARQFHTETKNIHSSPYTSRFLDRDWADTDHLLILGSGLSMVDIVYYLGKKAYKGKITSLSRAGLTPFPHAVGAPKIDPPFTPAQSPSTASGILKSLKSAIDTAQENKMPWQSVIDSLRPFSNDFWQSLLPPLQKKLWRAMSWWGPARHRIPLAAHEQLEAMREQGRLHIRKGHISEIKETDGMVQVTLKNGESITGTCAVHCVGFDYHAKNIESLCPDVELQTHWSGCLLPVNGDLCLSSSYPLYGIGPVFFGHFIETTAIPDIRKQAATLSAALTR